MVKYIPSLGGSMKVARGAGRFLGTGNVVIDVGFTPKLIRIFAAATNNSGGGSACSGSATSIDNQSGVLIAGGSNAYIFYNKVIYLTDNTGTTTIIDANISNIGPTSFTLNITTFNDVLRSAYEWEAFGFE
jgi:hypothetical protein